MKKCRVGHDKQLWPLPCFPMTLVGDVGSRMMVGSDDLEDLFQP